jgi:hypothetical protein
MWPAVSVGRPPSDERGLPWVCGLPPENFVIMREAAVNSWMLRIGDVASYARREHGGARLARRVEGATGTERGTVKSSHRPSPMGPSETVVATTAGRFCQGLYQTEAFSTTAWQTPRLPGEDSSISARMACKSSLAEITGKSRTSAQPRTQRKTSGEGAGLFARPFRLGEAFRCRHSKQAGTSSDSQQRLRKSSIPNAEVSWRRLHQRNPANCLKIIRIAQGRQVTCVPGMGGQDPLRSLQDLQSLR